MREVNKLLGEVGRERGGEEGKKGEGEGGGGIESSPVPHSLLKVDRRYIYISYRKWEDSLIRTQIQQTVESARTRKKSYAQTECMTESPRYT